MLTTPNTDGAEHTTGLQRGIALKPWHANLHTPTINLLAQESRRWRTTPRTARCRERVVLPVKTTCEQGSQRANPTLAGAYEEPKSGTKAAQKRRKSVGRSTEGPLRGSRNAFRGQPLLLAGGPDR